MLNHQAAQRGAVAAVVVLLDAKGFLGTNRQELTNKIANAVIDLLPQIEVMGIERIIEIKHPGLDLPKPAGARVAARGHGAAAAARRSATERRTLIGGSRFQRRGR